jgi:hypothetical protein
MSDEDDLKLLLERVNQRERKAQQRAVLYTLIPILMAGALIFFSWQQVASATQKLNETNGALAVVSTQLPQSQQAMSSLQVELDQATQKVTALQAQSDGYQKEAEGLRTQVEQYKAEIVDLQAKRDELQTKLTELRNQIDISVKQVDEVYGLRRYLYEGDLMTILKVQPLSPAQFELFYEILTSQGETSFVPGGTGPQKFDSPGFAVAMLTKHKLIQGSLEDNHYALIKMLKPVTQPAVGDIVFYESGYTMFYLEDANGQPLVVGMTPLGVQALRYDFAKVRMIGHIVYP